MEAFDLTAPLPGTGITVLEASAGTGKTFTLAALATRFIAEGARLDELLLITFSRAATQELRDRVREQLVAAAAELALPEATTPLGGVLRRDADRRELDDASIEVRRRRLLDAVAHYDAATIATTHEFCHAVLRSLGVAGNSDARETLREDLSGLTDDVVTDHYLARWSGTAEPPVTFKEARIAAENALAQPHAALRPRDFDQDSREAALVSFAGGVRDEVAHRKQRAAILTFDDLLDRLATALEGEDSAAAERMRARWKVILVDEFQDTDPVQWQVLSRAFAKSSVLVLIGDPKQAIYAFRGGDTPTYLSAVDGAETRTLDRNHRSDPAVVDALQALLRGAELGDEQIVVHPVTAAREGSSLSGTQRGIDYEVRGGVRLRRVSREGLDLTKSQTIRPADWKPLVAADVAADISRQLSAGASVTDPDGTIRPWDAGDVAILLHSIRLEGGPIQAELTKRGIPWVVNSADSVMTGPAAAAWLRLLEAMEQPSQPRRIHAAALTPFFDTTADQLVAGGTDLSDRLGERIRSWLDLCRSRGVAAVLAAAHADGLAARVLGWESGERILTDLNHVGELLHCAAQEDRLGLTGLTRWLRDAIDEGNRTDARRRRLDVDAQAVQFVTIHGSKGLEYPLVYLPGLFDRRVKDWVTTHLYHENAQRCLDVAGTEQARAQARVEEAQEDLRLAYVAMTRARAQLVLWWAPTWDGKNASLTRLLFGREPDGAYVSPTAPFPDTDVACDQVLKRWEAAGAFRLEDAVVHSGAVRETDPAPRLAARSFDRTLDLAWRRTSYSGLIRAEQVSVTYAEPEVAGTDDEVEIEPMLDLTAPEAPAEIAPELVSPMDGLAGGATFGSLVHAVLELADPEVPDLRAELIRHLDVQRRWWAVPEPTETLADALLPMNHSPLGPLASGLTLAEIPLRDRLRELDFEIPLADGDREGERGRRLADFATAIRAHLPPGDPVREYADKLDNPSLGEQVLRGYLSGSIDVVLRMLDETGNPRFVVVDYKTNTLGEPGRSLTALDYTPDKVTAAMVHSHYPLQALLYSVVLHRFLRWRLPAYDPETHLGGVLYLYVRGMVGPATPIIDGVPCGVFSWRPPTALILELSKILDGGRP